MSNRHACHRNGVKPRLAVRGEKEICLCGALGEAAGRVGHCRVRAGENERGNGVGGGENITRARVTSTAKNMYRGAENIRKQAMCHQL